MISADYRPTPGAPPALIFGHYAASIKRECGIDVFERRAAMKADESVLLRLLFKFRKDKTFADESILNEVWQEFLRAKGILSDEEQQAKDEYSLAKARGTKEALRESGLSDAPRFGFCKRTGCPSRKVTRLLLRGFCPDCLGVSMMQDATADQLQTSLTVKRKEPHKDTKRETTEERAKRVLAAKEQYPAASQREIARLTEIPQRTVSDILRNTTVKPTLENTDEVKQFLKDRAVQHLILKKDAKEYLRNRSTGAGPAAGDRTQIYVLAETAQNGGVKGVETAQTPAPCPRCRRSVIPAFHVDWQGRCLPTEKAGPVDVPSPISDTSPIVMA